MTVDRGVLRYGAAPVTSRLAADTTLAWRALTAGLILADAVAVGVAFALA